MKATKLALFIFFSCVWMLTSCQRERQQPVLMYNISNPADTGSRFPYLYNDNEGTIFMSWLMYIEEDIYALQYASYSDNRWTRERTIQVGTGFFVNRADFPSIVGVDGEVVAAHWLENIEGVPNAYNVEVSFPENTSNRWQESVTANLDGTATEHGFVSMKPLSDDKILAIWLDGRNTFGREHHEYDDTDKAMTLRSAEISKNGEITRKRIIDPVVCDCCPTDLVQIGDEFIAVYRGRTEGGVRDILMSRYNTETGEWNEPAAVHNDNWVIDSCPVNGPRAAVNGDFVAVTWYTEAGGTPSVLLARSADGGQTFDEPIIIAENDTAGRPDLLITDEGSVFVSWLQTGGELGYIMFREVLANGGLAEPVYVGATDASASSGFPRIEKTGNSILFAWTQTDPLVRVRTAKVDIR